MKILISLSAIRNTKELRASIAGWNKNRYNDIFVQYEHSRNKYRIYIPIGKVAATKKIIVPETIGDILESKGYVVEDYIAGIAAKKDNPKGKIKIGKLISDNPTIKHNYDNDKQRAGCKGVNHWVVISRHPYDILGMSFDRGWTSCMNMYDGCERDKLMMDIKYGTLVAYLIDGKNDRNINKPSARVLIKPFYDNKGNTKLMLGASNTVYGTAPRSFYDTVAKFCQQINKGKPSGKYVLDSHLYSDDSSRFHYSFLPSEFDNITKTATLKRVCEICSDDNLDPALIKIARQCKYWNNAALRAAVAKNESTPIKILLECSQDIDTKVVYEAACNNNATEQVLLEAIKFDNSIITERIAERANITELVFTRCFDTGLENVQIAVVSNPKVPEKVLLQAAKCPNIDLRVRAMSSIAATDAVLESSIVDDYELVRLTACSNPNMSAKLLTKFANSGSVSILEKVAKHPNSTPKILSSLPLNNTTMLALAGNTNTPAKILTAIAQSKQLIIKVALAKNTSTPAKLLKSLIEGNSASVQEAVIDNPSTPKKVICDAFGNLISEMKQHVLLKSDDTNVLKKALDDKGPYIQASAVLSKFITPELLDYASHLDNDEVKLIVAKNLQTPHDTLLRLAQDPYYSVAIGVLINPNSDSSILQVLAKHPNSNVRDATVGNKKADEPVLLIGINDTLTHVRKSAVYNYNVTKAVLDIAAKDTDSEIKDAAMQMRNYKKLQKH